MSKANENITRISKETCWVGSDRLTIEALEKVVYGNSKIGLSAKTWKELNTGHEFLKQFSKDKVI